MQLAGHWRLTFHLPLFVFEHSPFVNCANYMGLFDFIRRLLGGSSKSSPEEPKPVTSPTDSIEAVAPSPVEIRQASSSQNTTYQPRVKRPPIKLRPLDYSPSIVPTPRDLEVTNAKPYRFASIGPRTGEHLNLSRDIDERWLDYFGLPKLATPDDLADWLNIPIGKLAWLTHHTREGYRPKNQRDAHYHFEWIKKRSGGLRLIEAPKRDLKATQNQILHQLLDCIPTHQSAHGFVKGRSILSNAAPHIGSKFVLKLDLENFYPNVRYSRVVAIYRSMGFSREVSIWLARLTTSAPYWGLDAPQKNWEYWQLMQRHLPQGAPTSPALANLSAFGLDVRLSGLAKAYNMKYTRYADDLTFSGAGITIPALNEFIPLTNKIIADERFFVNKKKRKIIRNSQRQCVTGVVVNEKVNVSRKEFDRLKATLHNCVKLGPQTQNRNDHPNFSDHLRGKIAHVMQLNPSRGEKLLEVFEMIQW